MKYKLLICLILLKGGIILVAQQSHTEAPRDSWITKSLADEGSFILETDQYMIWGCAPIYDDEGKVHVYFSTWEKGGYWLTDSKIAHAVADHPEGPYKVLGTIMEGRGEGYWDAHTIHNPSIYRVDGKYVMLYIGNDTTRQEAWRDRAPAANTQRVGMAIADSPYGPWKRFDAPVVDVAEDSLAWDGYCTVNPGFLVHPSGEYWIYYRAWDRRNDDRRKTGVAMSKKLEGPYVKYAGNPIIDFPEYGGQTEDPYMFYYKGKFHCLIRDMGNFDWYSGLYLESDDGLHWGEYQRGHHKGSHYFPVAENARYERVQVLFKDGEPEYLFNAIQREGAIASGAVLKFNRPDLKIEFGKVSPNAVFRNDSMSIWGGSLVKGDDGLYHMYYSRWPKKLGWAWVTHSEIAHAVSNSPYGPFTFQDVALPVRGASYWDGLCTHNPTIHKFQGKYYLYYMGNTGDGKVLGSPGNHQLNWTHRNNQRIGVAVADHPDGPWERFDRPIIDISPDPDAPDALMASNPAITQRPDGGYLMIYKAVGLKYDLPNGGPVVHCIATADSPTGPFKKYDQTVFTIEGVRFPAEDPCIWFQDGKYRAIVKLMNHDENGKRDFSLVHYDSADGFDWKPARYHEITRRIVTWENGESQQFQHLERPQVYIEDGRPLAILCAADTLDENNVRQAFNLQIPLKITAVPDQK